MTVGLALLAAGGSTRLGTPKQLLAYRGESLLRHAAHVALESACRPVIVVLGAQAERMRQELSDLDVGTVETPDWRRGMGASLRTGLAALEAADPAPPAVLFAVCDQPLLTAAHLDALVAAWTQTGRSIVASAYGGTLGVPALFDRALFSELAAVADAEGAKAILRRDPGRVVEIAFPDGLVDIDTPADRAALEK